MFGSDSVCGFSLFEGSPLQWQHGEVWTLNLVHPCCEVELSKRKKDLSLLPMPKLLSS